MRVTLSIDIPRTSLWRWLLWLFTPRTLEIQIPQGWEDLSSVGRERLLKILMQRGAVSEDAIQQMIILSLTRIPRWVYYQLSPLQITESLRPAASWPLRAPISKPFDETIQINGRWLLVAPMASDMTVKHFLDLERAWMAFSKNEEGAIADFVATILVRDTPKNRAHLFKTGTLPNITQQQKNSYKKRLASITDLQLFYLIKYYLSQRSLLRDRYPFFYAPASDDDEPQAPGWDVIPARLAELGIFGSTSEVLTTPATIYLSWADRAAEKAAEKKQQTLQDIIRKNHQKFIN
jgi:hypothetical protein